jgi:hypothetical protein
VRFSYNPCKGNECITAHQPVISGSPVCFTPPGQLHGNCLSRAGGYAQATPVATGLFYRELSVPDGSCFKRAAVYADPAISAEGVISDGEVIGVGDKIPAAVLLQDPELMAAACTATAEGENVLIGIIDRKVNQSVFICLFQDACGLPDGDPLPFTPCQILVGRIIDNKANIHRIITPFGCNPAIAADQEKYP